MKTYPPKFLTPEDLAVRWGFHPESVRRIIRSGRIPAMQIGRRFLIKEADINAYERESMYCPAEGGI